MRTQRRSRGQRGKNFVILCIPMYISTCFVEYQKTRQKHPTTESTCRQCKKQKTSCCPSSRTKQTNLNFASLERGSALKHGRHTRSSSPAKERGRGSGRQRERGLDWIRSRTWLAHLCKRMIPRLARQILSLSDGAPRKIVANDHSSEMWEGSPCTARSTPRPGRGWWT